MIQRGLRTLLIYRRWAMREPKHRDRQKFILPRFSICVFHVSEFIINLGVGSRHKSNERYTMLEGRLSIVTEGLKQETGFSDKRWYVFRATYGREAKACEIISQMSVEVYLPMHSVRKNVKGKTTRVREPLLPNILFVHCDEAQAKELVNSHPQLSLFLRFYYNHLKTNADGKNPPLIIDEATMLSFIRVTGAENNHIKVVNTLRCHFKSGDMVRVTQGTFAGVEGRVIRVSGQQRVVVEIDGLCAVATAYIPNAFIEIL